jgi:hypothetical protein
MLSNSPGLGRTAGTKAHLKAGQDARASEAE